MTEEWKPICEGYEVSSAGRVRSTDRTIFKKDGRAYRLNGKLLAQNPAGAGYLSVMLGAGSRRLYVHRLVAEAFCEKRDESHEVNHKNGKITDNSAENLEWISKGENIAHSFRVLGRAHPMRGRRGKDSHSSKAVCRIDQKTGERRIYGSCGEAGRDGFDFSSVAKCCRGEKEHHKGFKWIYA